MKILDRYVLSSFIKNYLISLMVLIGMYIVLDMVFNFDELTEIRSTVAQQPEQRLLAVLTNIGSYYFYQGFLFFAQLSGIIPVVAAAFTLMRLSRFNELTAVLAAGVPLLRVAAPIIIASVVLNALLIVDQEVVIPQMIPQLSRSHDDLSKTRDYVDVTNIQDDRNALLYAAAYFPERKGRVATLETLDVIERNENLEVVGKITAELAKWDGSKWNLQNATRVTGLGEGRAVEHRVDVWETGLTPRDIDLYRNTDFVELLSTEQINGLLGKPKSFGTNMLLRVKHWRFTQPLMNVILLLLCIPAVLTRETGTLKTAATKCLLLAALGMGSIFLAHTIAGHPPSQQWASRWPAIMAWAPIFLFGPVAVYLLDRIKT
jgi:lipopolysaccharide export system permease protein